MFSLEVQKLKKWILCDILDTHNMSGTRKPEGKGLENFCIRCRVSRYEHFNGMRKGKEVGWYKFLRFVRGCWYELKEGFKEELGMKRESDILKPKKCRVVGRIISKTLYITLTVAGVISIGYFVFGF